MRQPWARRGMVVSIRRPGTPITRPIRGASTVKYQNTTLHTPLEHACLFTLVSMARLGCTSASRSTVCYSIDDILHTSYDVCIFLDSIEALKEQSTILIGSIFGELHNRYAINTSNYITVLPQSMLHINVLLLPYCSMMRIDEASLIIQTPTHHAVTMDYKSIQG